MLPNKLQDRGDQSDPGNGFLQAQGVIHLSLSKEALSPKASPATPPGQPHPHIKENLTAQTPANTRPGTGSRTRQRTPEASPSTEGGHSHHTARRKTKRRSGSGLVKHTASRVRMPRFKHLPQIGCVPLANYLPLWAPVSSFVGGGNGYRDDLFHRTVIRIKRDRVSGIKCTAGSPHCGSTGYKPNQYP